MEPVGPALSLSAAASFLSPYVPEEQKVSEVGGSLDQFNESG